MANVKISPEVQDVLNRGTVEGDVFKLPEGQLDRELYVAVDKVLKALGGKWKRGTGHVFPSDPSEKLGRTLDAGVAVDEKKQFQAFFTPPELAAKVVQMADVSGKYVLEPSAGEGALVKECLAQGAKEVHAIELNREHEKALYNSGASLVFIEDFLESQGLESLAERIVMNPPFTKNQDCKHVERAYNEFLKPGGKLVAIMANNQSRKPFQKLIEGKNYAIEEVDAGAFKDSGTMVRTLILTLWKTPVTSKL
jgi:predicted RNA methylase